MTDVDVLLLGPLEVRREGAPLRLGGRKPRLLVADLALHRGEVLSVDRLVDDLWGERPPRSAAHAVEVYVSQLRRELGLPVVTRPPGYVLDLEARCVDAERFATRAAEGSALVEGDPESAGAILREALALWRGAALADFSFEPFAQTEIARLEELREQCVEARVEADLRSGRHADLVSELEALVRASPFRERLRAQLMRALYLCGRTPDALALYRATREMLLEELAIEPGPELRAVEAAILRDDASLLARTKATLSRPAQRRLATIVAVELVDASDELDAEALHSLVVGWQERTTAVVGRYGGRVQSIGDESALAVFGVPFGREDDTLRAARAALELSEAGVRIGLETGEVAADGTLVAGQVLRRARAASGRAEPGAVVLGDAAAALLAHAARIDAETARLLSVADDAQAFDRRLDTTLVGRTHELATLLAALDDATREAASRAVLVTGAPGIGKTRLSYELAEVVLERATTFRGVCVPEGEGATYRPLEPIVRAAVGAVDAQAVARRAGDDAAGAALAAALGAGEGAPTPAEVAWAFRRLCESLANERPLVVVFDDAHWAEPSLLDLVEQLAASGRAPLLVLCLAREELLAERPSFLARAERIDLDALSPEETATLARTLVAGRPVAAEMLDRVIEGAEGNPLFVEQLLAFLAEEGTFVDRPLPPTIQAVLAARLDRLGPGERAVLARGAVIGRSFGPFEVSALLERGASAERHLSTLAARGYLRAAGAGYRFRHVLVQEAVYRATAKAERAELHERLADHLARREEADEIVGFHLERAHALHAELGADDRRVRQLAADAGARLGAAGMAAVKRSDVPATVGLLRRATSLLEADTPLAREYMCELGVALRAGNDAHGALEALERAARENWSAADAHIGLRARMELAFARLVGGRSPGDHELLELAEGAIPTFEALDDDRALGRAWLLAGYVHASRHLRYDEGREATELALVHYERARFPPTTALLQLATALVEGPTPADAAAARCEQLLSESTVGAGAEANVIVHLGALRAMLGRVDDGRALVRRGRAIFAELGQVGLMATSYGQLAGAIELLAGDLVAAERVLAESCELLQDAGLMSTFASRAGELAAVLYRLGRYDDAGAWLAAAESVTTADDLHARLASQPVRAKLLALAGEHARAEALVREAARAAEQTDALNIRARVFLDVGEVLQAGGRKDEAAACVERARAEYERKGNRLALERLAAPVPG